MTAVEFIFEELENRENGSPYFTIEQIYKKAKEMEKEQQGYSEEDMRKAFEWGVAHITFEEWLKQFKNK